MNITVTKDTMIDALYSETDMLGLIKHNTNKNPKNSRAMNHCKSHGYRTCVPESRVYASLLVVVIKAEVALKKGLREVIMPPIHKAKTHINLRNFNFPMKDNHYKNRPKQLGKHYQRYVAMPNKDRVKRFNQELRFLASLTNENIDEFVDDIYILY
ncbi:hypothetical protein LCGC14_0175830 [marine sediment metagenome]|uniref:Uncharacterized protein n=1 Tax=marine sediment metagenome TaxID=412755 RepID=A0A0F9UVE5_9ZZZZ